MLAKSKSDVYESKIDLESLKPVALYSCNTVSIVATGAPHNVSTVVASFAPFAIMSSKKVFDW
ncbi:Uncharacterised protein, partial [Mycoplasmopsis edwardii]